MVTTVSVLFSILNIKKFKKQDKIPSKINVIETEGLETRCFFFLFSKLLIVVHCIICYLHAQKRYNKNDKQSCDKHENKMP